MPTYREDLHTGHKVPLVEADDIVNGSITHEKLADGAVDTNNIKDRAVTEPKLADNSVSTRTIQNGAVTGEKIADGTVQKIMRPITDDLQNQIDSLTIHGMAVSNHFGINQHIGISQKTLTLAINKLWQKLGDITGESYMGISMVVTPEYFYGNQGCTVHVKATTEDAIGSFENIAFYVNYQIVRNDYDTDSVEFDIQIDDTSVITCYAQIMGMPYNESKTIHHYDAFWLGAGNAYSDVYNKQAAIVELDSHGRAAKDVTLTEGQHIIIVMGDYMKPGFIRADINGIEIEFTESTFTDGGNTYVVLTSVNAYSAGTVNIDING